MISPEKDSHSLPHSHTHHHHRPGLVFCEDGERVFAEKLHRKVVSFVMRKMSVLFCPRDAHLSGHPPRRVVTQARSSRPMDEPACFRLGRPPRPKSFPLGFACVIVVHFLPPSLSDPMSGL